MVKVLWGHPNRVYSSAFSPDSSVLCSVGASKAVRKRVPLRLVCEEGGWGCVTTYAESANAKQPLSPPASCPPLLPVPPFLSLFVCGGQKWLFALLNSACRSQPVL